MTQIGSNQPVQYLPQSSGVAQVNSNQSTSAIPQNAANTNSGYAYGEDVFQGQFQMFKSLYSNFDTSISKYSPFYGKMGEAQSNIAMPDQGNYSPQNSYQTNNGIPQSALGNGMPQTTGTTGNDLAIPQSALQVPPGLSNTQAGGQPTDVNTMPQTLPQPQTNVIPKRNPPSGPVLNNIQQLLQQEVQKISTPQKAIEVIASHAMLARQERTMANDIAWGAKFYASKAAEMAEKLNQNKRTMSPGQVQSQLRTIETYKLKSISLLNDAKKKAISNYNEALKATMLYNNYFTEQGQYSSVLNDNDRQFVNSELDKTWSTWEGGFDKNGQHADESPSVIDKAAKEVAIAIDKADKLSGAGAGA